MQTGAHWEKPHWHEFALGQPGMLSPREHEATLCAAEGLKTDEAALVMGIKPRTVEAHLDHAMQKFGATNRTHLIAMACTRGVIRTAGQVNFACLFINILVGIALAVSVCTSSTEIRKPSRRSTTARIVVRSVRTRQEILVAEL